MDYTPSQRRLKLRKRNTNATLSSERIRCSGLLIFTFLYRPARCCGEFYTAPDFSEGNRYLRGNAEKAATVVRVKVMRPHACDRPASECRTGSHIMGRRGPSLPIQRDTRRAVRGGELDVEKRFGIEILTGKSNEIRSAFDNAGAVELQTTDDGSRCKCNRKNSATQSSGV